MEQYKLSHKQQRTFLGVICIGYISSPPLYQQVPRRFAGLLGEMRTARLYGRTIPDDAQILS